MANVATESIKISLKGSNRYNVGPFLFEVKKIGFQYVRHQFPILPTLRNRCHVNGRQIDAFLLGQLGSPLISEGNIGLFSC